MKVKNKTIVVTGAGSGLGRELALNLLAKGAKVIALDISQKGLAETSTLATAFKGQLATYGIDITKRAEVDTVVESIIRDHRQIDGLINNAGIIQPFIKFNDLGMDAIDRVLNINLFGTIYLTKAFLPHLLSRPEAHIVNIASMGGFLPVPGQTIYCASKAAVKLLTEGLAAELSETGVKVSIVFPGAMNTNISGNSGLKPSANAEEKKMKILSPVDAANQIITAVEKDKSRILIGSDSKFMDKLYRLNPGFAAKMIYKKMRELLK